MRGSLAVAGRILLGLRGDKVTLVFVVGAPVLLFFLFGEVLDAVSAFNGDFLQPALMAVFLFLLTYVLTGVGFLRERQNDTLERLLATRIPRASIVLGYVLGFGALALVQSAVILGAGAWFLDVWFEHAVAAFFAIELLSALTALGFGILISLVARTEFQILQAVPVFIAPQIILGGVFVPVDGLALPLRLLAHAFPLTYIVDAMAYLILDQGSVSDLWRAVAVLAGFTVVTIALATVVVRRRA